jgi:hypothetical protein
MKNFNKQLAHHGGFWRRCDSKEPTYLDFPGYSLPVCEDALLPATQKALIGEALLPPITSH